MTAITAARVLRAVALLGALAGAPPLHAQTEIGTWVRQVTRGTAEGVTAITVEVCCGGTGRRLTYRLSGMEATFTVESRLDGSEAPVLLRGKPQPGWAIAITRIDDHHAVTVITMNGNPFRTSNATLSADGRTLTVENEFGEGVTHPKSAHFTETWVRK